MQVIFQCSNPDGRCHAMTMVWLAASIEQRGADTALPLQIAPLEMLQDAYDAGAHLGPNPGSLEPRDHDRLALRFFGFDVAPQRTLSGAGNAMAFHPLNHMATDSGHSYMSLRGFGEGHCLGSRVHASGWDIFDANFGLVRYASASEFRTGVRRHLLFNHLSQTVDDWVVVPVRGRTEPWVFTVTKVM